MAVAAPDPREARSPAEFVASLRRWKARTGLNYREIERRARRAGDRLPASTLATVLGRRTLPRGEVIEALARAFGGDERTVGEWRAAVARLTEAGVAPASAAVATAVPRQLPGGLATFVGRAKILDGLSAVVAPRSAPPIVAIVGPGGVGKTALAVQWLRSARDEFPDGQLFVDLKGFSDGTPVAPGRVLYRFLRSLGVAPDAVPAELEERAALYRSVLAERRVVVMLDNARDAAQVRPLLPGSPSCLTVVTSRGGLSGLGVSHDVHSVSLDALAHEEAMQLLVRLLGAERVHADVAAAEELTERCRSLPLALRLAAAQLAAEPGRPLESLVRRLAGAGRLSTLAVADDPTTALRSTFDLSYDALGPAARRLFVLSGLHPGPDMEATGLAALSGLEIPDAEELLDELATLHLVRRTGADRWLFHDLVREYAAERLASDVDAEERSAASVRLLDWYAVAVDAAIRHIAPARQQRAVEIATALPVPEFGGHADAAAWLDAEHPAVVELVNAAADGGHSSRLFALTSVWRFFMVRGQWEELLAVSTVGLAEARRVEDSRWQSVFLNALGGTHASLGDPAASLEYFRQALDVARHMGEPRHEAAVRANLGSVYGDLGRYAEARAESAEALRLFERGEDRESAAAVLRNLSRICVRLGAYEEAYEHARRSVELFTEQGERFGKGLALSDLGGVAFRLGRVGEARELLERALAVDEVGPGSGRALIHSRLALVAAAAGDARAAERHRGLAYELCASVEEPGERGEALNDLGESLSAQGDRERAAGYFGEALRLVEDVDAFEAERARRGLGETE